MRFSISSDGVASALRQLGTLVLALLLVSTAALSGVGGSASPVGDARAAGFGDCSPLDDFIYFLTVRTANEDSCSRQAYASESIEEMKQLDANQTKLDIYSAAAGQKAGREAGMAPFDNYLTDSESVAWMKAETAVASAYTSGMNQSQARAAAKQAVEDYYAVKQHNLAEQYRVDVSQWHTLRQQAEMESNLSADYVDGNITYTGNSDYEMRFRQISNESVETVNGSTVAVPVADFAMYDITYDNGWGNANISFGVDQADAEDTSSIQVHGLIVKSPDAETPRLNYLPDDQYSTRWTKIENQTASLKADAGNFVNATYGDFQSGELNASEIIGRNTAMFEYGVRQKNTSDGLWRSTAAIALGGFDTPNLTSTGSMTVQYQGETHVGVVFARNAPNGSWQAGATYYPESFDGPVFMATENGTKIDFAGEFTITSIKDKNGEEIGTVQTTKYRYQTANTSELLAIQQQLLELRQEIEDREPAPSGGGSGDSGSLLDDLAAVLGVSASVAGAILIGGVLLAIKVYSPK